MLVRARAAGCFTLLLALEGGLLPVWSQTLEWYAGIARVRVRSDLNRRPGTAFVVALRLRSAYLVTSAHVVEGDAGPQIEFVADPEKPYRATVRGLEAGEERGLALLVVNNPPAGLRTIPASGQPARRGDSVTVAGFPASLDAFSVVDATIASLKGRDIFLSRETDEGFSGGPVLRGGAAVGLVYGREAGFGKVLGVASIKPFVEGNGLSWEAKAEIVQPTEAKGPLPGETRTNPKDGLTYVWIPPGEFEMGCSPGDNECFDDEKPPHQVKITRGFWLGQTEVTQAAYQQVIGTNPSRVKGPQHPVEMVSWYEARDYCKAVGGRLPTEAEWEYAARAGSQQARYGELDKIAWYDSNSRRQPHPVGQKQKNAWGLYDMLGNVWEWVSDWFHKDYYKTLPSTAVDPKGPPSGVARVLRGGSWDNREPGFRRASSRTGIAPENRDGVGFRCAWVMP